MRIVQATLPSEIEAARELILEYQKWLNLDLSFQRFEEEVISLPGKYAPPSGRLLLAEAEGAWAGCIALRALDGVRCEMKRLYVRDSFRGRGAGKMLVTSLMHEAQSAGYSSMYLDTLPSMKSAQALYASFGFRDTEPYYPSPLKGTRFMKVDLHR